MSIGQNDLCKLGCVQNGTLPQFDAGNHRSQTPKEFSENVKKVLDKLMRGLPKSLVALILPPGTYVHKMKNLHILHFEIT